MSLLLPIMVAKKWVEMRCCLAEQDYFGPF
ncbi:Lanthionine synthetase C-like [Penicillium camemberti]|uniref:Lanthionine synthetase C-like n=1 Tax=Penicillium camemberti (strain FM 013) TaxID=1429867 RepID=A0A0G4PLP4_PENC3|nr:Lanthionine synthetase C-like [Penicillium camemberti]